MALREEPGAPGGLRLRGWRRAGRGEQRVPRSSCASRAELRFPSLSDRTKEEKLPVDAFAGALGPREESNFSFVFNMRGDWPRPSSQHSLCISCVHHLKQSGLLKYHWVFALCLEQHARPASIMSP